MAESSVLKSCPSPSHRHEKEGSYRCYIKKVNGYAPLRKRFTQGIFCVAIYMEIFMVLPKLYQNKV